MPYICVSANGEEIDRRELCGKGLTVGRSPTCDVPVLDILLSRQHCRIEPETRGGTGPGTTTGRWRVIDLGSKNGTHFNWSKVTTRTLSGGDTLRVGRTWVTFHSTPFVEPAAGELRRGKIVRPADPFEALGGTVSDFTFVEPASDAAPTSDADAFDVAPSPALRPADPLSAGSGYAFRTAPLDGGVATAEPTKVAGRTARRLAQPQVGLLAQSKPTDRHAPPRRLAAHLCLQADVRQVIRDQHQADAPRVAPRAWHKNRLGLALVLTALVCAASALAIATGLLMAAS